MPLDYTKYVSKLTIKPCSAMPQPPESGVTNPVKWTQYADAMVDYREEYIDYIKSLRAWAIDQAALLDTFRTDLMAAYSLTTNPKADALYQLAAVKNKTSMEEIEATVSKLAPLVL